MLFRSDFSSGLLLGIPMAWNFHGISSGVMLGISMGCLEIPWIFRLEYLGLDFGFGALLATAFNLTWVWYSSGSGERLLSRLMQA